MQKNLYSSGPSNTFVSTAPKSPYNARNSEAFMQTQGSQQLHIKTDQENLNNNDYVQQMDCINSPYNCTNTYSTQIQYQSYGYLQNEQAMSPSYGANLSPHPHLTQVMGPPNPVPQSPLQNMLSPAAASHIQHSFSQQVSPHPTLISPGYQQDSNPIQLSPHPASANLPIQKQMFIYPPYTNNNHLNGGIVHQPRKLHHQRVATLSGDKSNVPRSAGYMLSQQHVPLTPGYVNYSKPVTQDRTYPGSLPNSPFISGDYLQQNQTNGNLFVFPTVPDENSLDMVEQDTSVVEKMTQLSPNEPLQDLGDIEEDLVPDSSSADQSISDIFAHTHSANSMPLDATDFDDVNSATQHLTDNSAADGPAPFANEESFGSAEELLCATSSVDSSGGTSLIPAESSSVAMATTESEATIKMETELCNERSGSSEKKKRGRRSGSPKTAAQCFTCGKLFNNSSALAKHKLTHSDERKYICQICNKGFKRQDHLNGHLLTHQSKKPFACRFDQCDKSYCDARSLRRHLENVHHLSPGTINRGGWDARSATFSFDLQGAAGYQIRVSSAYGQQFSPVTPGEHPLSPGTKNRLVQPRLSGRPPVECSVCGRKFKNMPALNGHMRLHGGFVKPKPSDTQQQLSSADLLAFSTLSQGQGVSNWPHLSSTAASDFNPLLAQILQSSVAHPGERKRKHRPQPLVIPPHLSNFHTLGFGFPSQLRSPWQRHAEGGFGSNLAPPYTPPPMLSPMRTGSGLFYSILARELSTKTSAVPPLTPIKEEEQGSQFPIPAAKRTPITSEGLPPATDVKPHINCGPEYQAAIPDLLEPSMVNDDVHSADVLWKPKLADSMDVEKMELLLEFACSMAVPFGGDNREYLFHVLNRSNGDLKTALLTLLNSSNGQTMAAKHFDSEVWTEAEQDSFQQCLSKYEKDFFRISEEMKTKSTKQCVDYYYLWKKLCPEDHKKLRAQRRRRELEERHEMDTRSQSQQGQQSYLPFSTDHLVSTATPPPVPVDFESQFAGVRHEEVSFPCEYCSKVFTKLKARNAHVKVHKVT